MLLVAGQERMFITSPPPGIIKVGERKDILPQLITVAAMLDLQYARFNDKVCARPDGSESLQLFINCSPAYPTCSMTRHGYTTLIENRIQRKFICCNGELASFYAVLDGNYIIRTIYLFIPRTLRLTLD